MIFISYTKTDSYYEFVGENGNKQIYPVGSIILTDDESGMIAIKNTASRQTIGLVVKPEPPFSGKFKLTLNDSSTVTAECTSTAETIAKSEISAYSASVTSAVIGQCVTSIGSMAFRGCTGLTSVTIEDGVETIGEYAFYNCKSLTSITLPESAVISGGNTFENCSALTSVNIPTATTSIDLQTFRNCYSLTSITIPNSVTSIGSMAFRGCTGLTSVTCNATTPPSLSFRVFDNTNNCPIYVPCESVEAYKASSTWSDYADRITAIV